MNSYTFLRLTNFILKSNKNVAQTRTSVVHGDFRLDNIIFDKELIDLRTNS